MAVLALNRKKQALAPDVRGLVKSLTGFEDDKLIQECENYVFSNFLHYQQPMVDGFNVQKSIDGLVLKFTIHGFPEKGEKLKALVDKFIASTLFKDHGQTGVEWYVLQLMIKLAYKPTHSINDNPLPVLAQPEISPEDSFDWGTYLKEGWEKFQLPDNDEESDERWTFESEEDSLSDPDLDLPVVNSKQEKFKAVGSVYNSSIPNPATWKKKAPPNETKHEATLKIVKECTDSEAWLKHNVQNSWWKEGSKYKENVSSKFKSANFSEIWNQYQKNISNSKVQDLLVISEYKVLKEILWMFQVPTSTALFSQDENGKHKVKNNVTIPSLTQNTLECILTGLCPYFDQIYDLKTFRELLKEHETEGKPPPFTYKAFCVALMKELDSFIQVVVDIETKVDKQDQSNTVISVVAELDTALKQLEFVHKVYKQCVTDWRSLPCWVCSTRLLSELYGILLTPANNTQLGIALDLFIASFSVYLNIIDTWLCEGRLEDWREEFIVCRNGEDLDVMPYEVEMKKYGTTPVSFLSKLVHMVKDAGRSMAHIIKLDKLHILRKSAHNKGNLYKEFVENLNREFEKLYISIHGTSLNVSNIGNENPDINLLSSHNKLTNFAVEKDLPDNYQNKLLEENDISVEFIDVKTTNQQKQNEFNRKKYLCAKNTTICDDKITVDEAMHTLTTVQLIDNLFLSEVFEEYLKENNENTIQNAVETNIQLRSYRSTGILDMICVDQVLEEQLSLIRNRHASTETIVTKSLISDYHLIQHFTVLRKVLLMEAGNLIQNFYSFLFKEMASKNWRNARGLTMQLVLSIEGEHPELGANFSVMIRDEDSGNHKTPIAEICDISIGYTVEWPVSMVISTDAIAQYNSIFSFLLCIKYAFWSLYNLRFSDLNSTKENTLKLRRLFILKMWLQHCVTVIHFYFMGHVFHSYATQLQETVQQAGCTDDIINAHIKFLSAVQEHCLQKTPAVLKLKILQTLELCPMLETLWRLEIEGKLTEDNIAELEDKYMKAHNTLSLILESIIENASELSYNIGHLAELSSEISSSLPGGHYDGDVTN